MTNKTLGINSEEHKMFLEVSKVLKKYGALKRKFGLFEVHTHFPMNEDEVLYETNNPSERTHNVVVKSKGELSEQAKPTQWVIEDGEVLVSQYCCK